MNPIARARTAEAVARLEKDLKELHSSRSAGSEGFFGSAFDLFEAYERISVPLYRLRVTRPPDDSFRRRIEDSVAAVSHEILALQGPPESKQSAYAEWLSRYRMIWMGNFDLFVHTGFLFLGSVLAGWSLATRWPEYSLLIIPQSLLEAVINKQSWFASIQKNPILEGFEIAANNIQVAIKCFVLGSAFGVGGMYIVVFNGLLLGALFGFCKSHGFEEQLGEFVVGHGFLELTIIVASAFGGFLVGREFFHGPWSTLIRRIGRAGRAAGVILTGILPWLLLAACIEVGFSPWPFYPLKLRLAVGLVAGASFWIWSLCGPIQRR